ncbi:MAG: hypothetical protein A3B25_01925 [Candidatus Ryanbacteria bacterium RIFCSPLOWO2_01_FULL_48_26]|uniref:Uncharacterized protein n=1 Tax=Candidatus Ryanbacteria bacterium RIFCSPLOWO2_01_FULL_48_26 TaxID=1802126 RepID=A0A1G2GQM3_9BACT|nr:MAG: hypothetical protein A3B25_01925 [Candidatus Ryanbacteria bacterium RIFCSPLOWO2_01_FULL_48_26]
MPYETLATLGLCEHCGIMVSMANFPADAMGAEWHCPNCKGILGHVSFGFDKATSGAKKIKWVGPGGTWTDVEPKDDFKLGEIYVHIHSPRY